MSRTFASKEDKKWLDFDVYSIALLKLFEADFFLNPVVSSLYHDKKSRYEPFFVILTDLCPRPSRCKVRTLLPGCGPFSRSPRNRALKPLLGVTVKDPPRVPSPFASVGNSERAFVSRSLKRSGEAERGRSVIGVGRLSYTGALKSVNSPSRATE